MKIIRKVDAFCDFLRMKNSAESLNDTEAVRHLIQHSIFHAYVVCALGTIFNAIALWCITTCDKTNSAVKFLLSCIFLSLLLLSCGTRPLLSINMSSILRGEASAVPDGVNLAVCSLYVVLAEGDMWCIAAVAFFRGTAVWSARHHKLSIYSAVRVVVSIYLFIVFSNIGLAYLLLKEHFTVMWVALIYCVCHIFGPLIVTLACYGTMAIAVQHSKRQLARVESKPSPALDQATSAILAVFLLNLVIGFPHAVYHFLPTTTLEEDILFHTLFSCHFFVDPIVFLWFNKTYRNRIARILNACLSKVLRICHTRRRPSSGDGIQEQISDSYFRSCVVDQSSSENDRGEHLELEIRLVNENDRLEDFSDNGMTSLPESVLSEK